MHLNLALEREGVRGLQHFLNVPLPLPLFFYPTLLILPIVVPQVSLRDPSQSPRSALRGLYITLNESCQFYYQRSRAPLQNKKNNRLHGPHLPSLIPNPPEIGSLDQFVIQHTPPPFTLSPLQLGSPHPRPVPRLLKCMQLHFPLCPLSNFSHYPSFCYLFHPHLLFFLTPCPFLSSLQQA